MTTEHETGTDAVVSPQPSRAAVEGNRLTHRRWYSVPPVMRRKIAATAENNSDDHMAGSCLNIGRLAKRTAAAVK
jgi:hypothetical protein